MDGSREGSDALKQDWKAVAAVCTHLRLDPVVYAGTVERCLPCEPISFMSHDPFADLVALGRSKAEVREAGSSS